MAQPWYEACPESPPKSELTPHLCAVPIPTEVNTGSNSLDTMYGQLATAQVIDYRGCAQTGKPPVVRRVPGARVTQIEGSRIWTITPFLVDVSRE